MNTEENTFDNTNQTDYNEEGNSVDGGNINEEGYYSDRQKDAGKGSKISGQRTQKGNNTEGYRSSTKDKRISVKRTAKAQGKAKTEISIDNNIIAFDEPSAENITNKTKAAIEGLRNIGIENTFVHEGNIEFNGRATRDREASTLLDFGVLINNNADISSEEMVGHEGFHYYLNKQNNNAIQYKDILLENFDITEEKSNIDEVIEEVK